MSNRISIILPVISIALIYVLLARPEITGFVTAPGNILGAEIKVSTAEGVILPAGSVVKIELGDEASAMPLDIFIDKSGSPYELVRGEVQEIDYTGYGYTGNYSYVVPISEFNLSGNIQKGMK